MSDGFATFISVVEEELLKKRLEVTINTFDHVGSTTKSIPAVDIASSEIQFQQQQQSKTDVDNESLENAPPPNDTIVQQHIEPIDSTETDPAAQESEGTCGIS